MTTFISSCLPYLVGLVALLSVALYVGADAILSAIVCLGREVALIARYLRTRGLVGLWIDLCELVCRIMRATFGPLIANLSNTKPLPEWTNVPLALLGVAIWAFAISLSWLGDNLTYVLVAATLIGCGALGIFVRVGATEVDR